ncbi:Transcription factor, fungi [Penicillium italicum]|uniref:Transcription factor, fungi n=1 Tax=Penicillium italicum TaxID=40296 RepID=A0A0A2KDR5_PENIT|nr:Transcription factor, fungi [Penicillium italicum]
MLLMYQALFSSTASAFQFEPLMLSEAAIMAQTLGYNRSNGPHENTQRRTFWILYYMEKVSCFITGKVSVLQDSNISCPIPDAQESTFGDYDWGFSFLQYARLVSKIQSSLFTISSVNQPAAEYNAKVQSFLTELESWRLSAPGRFRAGETLKPRLLREPLAQTIALLTNYLYFHALLTLSWTLLHFSAIKLGPMRQLDLKRGLMRTARSVLELTKFIEVAPYTPVWMLAVLPLSCLMILFDLVVHNPDHPEASLSLALLDIASGHFSRLEFASNGTLPGSLVAQFAHLARQYIFEKRESKQKMIDMGVHDSSCDVHPEVPTGATEMPPLPAGLPNTGVSTSNQPAQTLPGIQEQLSLDPGAPLCDSTLLNENDQLFIPSIDDPSYRIEDLELLGIDLKDLFDYPYGMIGGDTFV